MSFQFSQTYYFSSDEAVRHFGSVEALWNHLESVQKNSNNPNVFAVELGHDNLIRVQTDQGMSEAEASIFLKENGVLLK